MSNPIFKNDMSEEAKFILLILWQKPHENGEGGGICSDMNRKCELTSLIRWPGVVDKAQVQTFLLGYFSGQLGLIMDTGMLVITWSQPAECTNTKNDSKKQK